MGGIWRVYLHCPERVTEMEEEKREEQRSRGGSFAPLGGRGGGHRTRTLLLSDDSVPGCRSQIWTPPAKQAAAECFIKLPQLGVRTPATEPAVAWEHPAAQSSAFRGMGSKRTSGQVRFEAGSKHAWLEIQKLLSIHGIGARFLPSLRLSSE